MKLKCILISILFLAGCASGRAVFMENRHGDYRVCEVSDQDAGMMGVFFRDREIDQCIQSNYRDGYKTTSTQQSNDNAGRATGVMLQSIGQSLQNSTPVPQNTNCTSQVIGNTVYTNCH